MRLQQFLNEKFLRSEYKFGFELEAITKDLIKAKSFIFKYFKGDMDDDTSIDDYDEDKENSFEFKSDVYALTPQNINNFIKLIEQLPKNNIRTNESCGFHIHLSYPHLNVENTRWIILNLAMDSKIRNEIIKFNEVEFFSYDYADTYFLDEIKEALNDENYIKLNNILTNEKHRLVRIHPQGTLEWRGPRGDWLNSGNVRTIKDFVLKLYKFVDWIIKTLDSKTLSGTNIKRKDLIEKLDNEVSPIYFDKHKTLITKLNSKKQDMTILSDIIKYNKWILSCDFKNAIFDINNKNELIIKDILFKDGTIKYCIWENGKTIYCNWENGIWKNGEWRNGVWKNGIWENGILYNVTWWNGVWKNGIWFDGLWEKGTWEKGTWSKGTWKHGIWKNGEWKAGTWENGVWENGIWKNGLWRDGIWKNGKWKNGTIYSKKHHMNVYTKYNPTEYFKLEKNSVNDFGDVIVDGKIIGTRDKKIKNPQ